MSENDWKVGDLALCIADSWNCECGLDTSCCPKMGDILRVTTMDWLGVELMLHFEGKPEDQRWHHSGFRKIHPKHEPADDALWVDTLKRFRKLEPA